MIQKFEYILDNLDYTVSRKIVRHISEMLSRFGSPNKSIRVYLEGETEDSLDKYGSDDSDGFLRNSLVEADYTEITNTELLNVNASSENLRPVFLDEDINFAMSPIFLNTDTNISLKFRSKSREAVKGFIGNLKNKFIHSGVAFVCSPECNIHVPRVLQPLFEEIISKKNSTLTNKLDMVTYLKNNLYNGFWTSNVIGDNKTAEINVRININNVQVVIKTSLAHLKEQHNTEKNEFYAEIELALFYDKPQYIQVRYPSIINNQLLANDFVKTYSNTKRINGDYFQGVSNVITEYYAKAYEYKEFPSYYKIPYFDHTSILPKTPDCMIRLSSVLIKVLPDKRKDVFNIVKVPGLIFKDDVIEFLKDDYKYFTKRFMSFFYVNIYCEDKIIDNSILEIDKDLNITSKVDLDISKNYRVCFNILTDMKMVPYERRLEMLKHKDMFNTFRSFLGMDINYSLENPKPQEVELDNKRLKEIRNGMVSFIHTKLLK